MDALVEQISILVGGYVPKLLGAILLLVVGGLASKFTAGVVLRFLERVQFNARVAHWTAMEPGQAPPPIDKRIATATFVMLMFFVLVGFFQILSLTLVTEPLNRFLVQVFEYAPRLFSAALLALIGWLVAGLVRVLAAKLADRARLNQRIADWSDEAESDSAPVAKTVSDALFWLVLLLFLPAVLTAMNLGGLLDPVQKMIEKLLAALPDVLAATVILVTGWYAAKIVRHVVQKLADGTNLLGVAEKIGIRNFFVNYTPGELLGRLAYFVVIIPILIAALNVLRLDALTRPASDMLKSVLNAIPLIFAAGALLFIAYCVGRVLADMTEQIALGLNVDDMPTKLGFRKRARRTDYAISAMIGRLVLVAIMLIAAMEACDLVRFQLMAELLQHFLTFAGRIVLGLVIFGVSLYLANLVTTAVVASTGDQSGLLAIVARTSIILLGGAMALQHMGFADEIIKLAFGILFGAVAVAAAIAFGWGGREIAGRLLQEFVESHQSGPPKRGRRT